jgi:hypothetical protein
MRTSDGSAGDYQRSHRHLVGPGNRDAGGHLPNRGATLHHASTRTPSTRDAGRLMPRSWSDFFRDSLSDIRLGNASDRSGPRVSS